MPQALLEKSRLDYLYLWNNRVIMQKTNEIFEELLVEIRRPCSIAFCSRENSTIAQGMSGL